MGRDDRDLLENQPSGLMSRRKRYQQGYSMYFFFWVPALATLVKISTSAGYIQHHREGCHKQLFLVLISLFVASLEMQGYPSLHTEVH